MPTKHKGAWFTAAGIMVVVLAVGGWFIMGKGGMRLPGDRQAPPRPMTINNVLLRIESNISRIQSTMENLVFSEHPANLADDVESVNQLAATVDQDFKEMGALLPAGNAQYKKALAQLHEWKGIRDEIIKLTTGGPSPKAKEIVRSKSEAQVHKLRASLKELESFSQKRTDDFDAKPFDAPEKRSKKE